MSFNRRLPARELTQECGVRLQAEGGAIAAALKERVDATVAAKEKAEAAEAKEGAAVNIACFDL